MSKGKALMKVVNVAVLTLIGGGMIGGFFIGILAYAAQFGHDKIVALSIFFVGIGIAFLLIARRLYKSYARDQISNPQTLREILAIHPEWADLPIAIYREDGEFDYVGHSGSVYLQTYEDVDYVKEGEDLKPTIVFSGN